MFSDARVEMVFKFQHTLSCKSLFGLEANKVQEHSNMTSPSSSSNEWPDKLLKLLDQGNLRFLT